MHPSQPPEHDVRTPRTAELCFSWSAANHRGLDLAHHGDWSLAADAFAEAVDLLAGAEPQEPGTHDALALVLSNLAVACFRADRLDDGIRHAQRACALRVALVGEDAVAVARARSDLAVMLCAAGRTDEAAALIHRAIVGVEHHAGDEDLRLVPLLENAARVAMAIGQPAAAEPHLLRLHALLAAHDLPVESAEFLLRKVAMSRNQRRPATPAEQAVAENAVAGQAIAAHSAAGPSPAPAAASLDAPADTPPDLRADVAIEHADALELVGDTRTIELQAIPRETLRETPREIPRETPSFDADDQPLRDAVALTGVLLRTTPTGAPVVRHRDANADVWRASEVPDDNPLPHHLPERGLAHVREGDVREAVAHIASQAHAESVQSHDALETMRSRTLAPIADPMPIDLEVTAAFAHELERDLHATLPSSSSLGFRVEYGFDGYEEQHRASSDAQPEQQVTPTGSSALLHGHDDDRTEPVAVGADHDAALRNSLVMSDEAETDAPRARLSFGAALRAGRATAPRSSHGVLVTAVITLSVAAASVWIYLNNGF